MEESAKQLPQLNMTQYKSLLKEEIARCPTRLSTNKKRINERRRFLWENFKAARINKIGHIVPIHQFMCSLIHGVYKSSVLYGNFRRNLDVSGVHNIKPLVLLCLVFGTRNKAHKFLLSPSGNPRLRLQRRKKDQEQLINRQLIIIASSNLPQCIATSYPRSFFGKDPGVGWSRDSQNLGFFK